MVLWNIGIYFDAHRQIFNRKSIEINFCYQEPIEINFDTPSVCIKFNSLISDKLLIFA